MFIRRHRYVAVLAAVAAFASFASVRSAVQPTDEIEAQQVVLAQYTRLAADAIASCNQQDFTAASVGIQGIKQNAERARRHLVEQEVDLGLARRELLDKQDREGDSSARREEIQRFERAKSDLDIPIKRWQRLVVDASQQLEGLTARFKENCAKQKAAGEGTRTRVNSPEPKPTPPKDPGPPPVTATPGARVVCAPCQELANQLFVAEIEHGNANFRYVMTFRPYSEAAGKRVNLEERLKELKDRFNHQIGKGASSGIDPDTGRPIDSRFIATGQVQITRTGADGTTTTEIRESSYMNALKEQIVQTEKELGDARKEEQRTLDDLNAALAEVEAARARCEELEKQLEDCVKKYCTQGASARPFIGLPGASDDTAKWRGSAPGVVVGRTATVPDDPDAPYEYGAVPNYDPLRRMMLNMVKTPEVLDTGSSAPADPTHQLMIIIVARVTAPPRKAGQAPKSPALFAPLPAASVATGWNSRFGWPPPTRLTSRGSLPAVTVGVPQGSASQVPRVRTYLTSLGVSTGEAFELRLQNDGPAAIDLVGDGVVVEPIQERGANPIRREMQKLSENALVVPDVQGYCLEFLREPPAKNMLFRIANREMQQRFEPARRIIGAAQQLQDKRAFTPDSDPAAYFHSIRQWAIWTHEQRFDAQSFGTAFVEHTRKNLQSSGRQWSKPIEDAVRGFVPGRWRDIQQVLGEAGVSTR